jgi:hypothetical protein
VLLRGSRVIFPRRGRGGVAATAFVVAGAAKAVAYWWGTCSRHEQTRRTPECPRGDEMKDVLLVCRLLSKTEWIQRPELFLDGSITTTCFERPRCAADSRRRHSRCCVCPSASGAPRSLVMVISFPSTERFDYNWLYTISKVFIRKCACLDDVFRRERTTTTSVGASERKVQ